MKKSVKDFIKLEEGWDSDFCPSLVQPASRSRPKLDTELLSLQASWSNSTKQEHEEIKKPSKYKIEKQKSVKNGEINYDAPLFLKAIHSYDERSTGKNISQTRRNRSMPISNSVGQMLIKSSFNEDSYYEEWKNKWDFIYDYVELEKVRLKAVAKLANREKLLYLTSQADMPTHNMDETAFPQRRRPSHQSSKPNMAPKTQFVHQHKPSDISFPAIAKITVSAPLSWEEFEAMLKNGSESIRYHDIPWPPTSEKIIKISKSTNAKDIKIQIRKALIRWHPDKFQKILSRISDSEEKLQAVLMVQEVTRRIISEKEASSL